MKHDLKIRQAFFDAVKSGKKTFEIRRFDRPYAVGDELVLRAYDDGTYLQGEALRVKITYILYCHPGIADGFCVLGIRKLTKKEREQDAD